jgi:uncharacterized iron-regulated protein
MTHVLAAWSIALLLGGMTLFSAVFAPLVFTRLPAEQAGRFIRAVFPWYYLYILACSGMATLWLALAPQREGLSWMMMLVFVTAIYARQVLMPRINALRDRGEAGDAEAAAEFTRRHTHSVWLNGAQWLASLVACALMAAGGAPATLARTAVGEASEDCTVASGWVDARGVRTDLEALIAAHADKRVWLLGEQHDQPAHHAWQLEVLAALYADDPSLAIAMEMFPREAQPALDAWVAGNIDWPTLLTTSHWDEVWGFPPDLYRPLLEFARAHGIRLIAMNVHPSATHAVARGGPDALPEELRLELGTPAEASEQYRDELQRSFQLHQSMGLGHSTQASQHEGANAQASDDNTASAAATADADTDTDADADNGQSAAEGTRPEAPDEAVERFIAAQLTWDRAMASAIHRVLDIDRAPSRVVGLLGGGHTGHDRGVPLQLQALGVSDSISLLASEPGSLCGGSEANPLMADARFVLPPEAIVASSLAPAPARPRLGVALGLDVRGAMILSVEPGSLGEREGLQAGDVIIELAGRPCESPAQVVDAVQRQPAGTWLPLTLQRGSEQRAQVIRFPNEP